MIDFHRAGVFKISAVFGPQHGIWGHTQDNMIEWEGYEDSRTGLKFYSLYGKTRVPTKESLSSIDTLVIDLQDVGSRYYTFIWTLANCLQVCELQNIKVCVLDRPNPLGGISVEDCGWKPEYKSFVGLWKLPVRHGLSIGEIALHLRDNYFPKVELEVVMMERWNRVHHWPHTQLPWGFPSPNMPSYDTALVYPGQCLLEGTKLSEGRGTTRPFEMFGAPFIDGWKLCEKLNDLDFEGVTFRPVQFQPTFQKYAGEVCQGAFIHITDTLDFRPLETTAVLLTTIADQYPDYFQWQDPPYEYEEVLLPFDILTGGSELRKLIESGGTKRVQEFVRSHHQSALDQVTPCRLYS